jgi:hypothetical protein
MPFFPCKLLKSLMLVLWHRRVYSNPEFLQVTSAFVSTLPSRTTILDKLRLRLDVVEAQNSILRRRVKV